jgi:hypothetical protein
MGEVLIIFTIYTCNNHTQKLHWACLMLLKKKYIFCEGFMHLLCENEKSLELEVIFGYTVHMLLPFYTYTAE